MILILGSGFIGNAIAQACHAAGLPVRMFSRSAQTSPHVDEYIQGNLREIQDFPEVFAGVRAVVHCIHTSVPSNSNLNLPAEVEANLVPTLRMVELMKAHGVGRLVYLSSGGAVYGPGPHVPLGEDAPTLPISGYGVTKLAIEHFLRLNQLLGNVPNVTVLRPSNVYGPGQRLHKPQGVIGHIFKAALAGQPFQQWGDGSFTKDYLYITDFAAAVRAFLHPEAPQGFGVYNVSAGQGHTLLEILHWAEKALGRPIAVDVRPAPPTDVPYVVLSHQTLTNATGWLPQVPLPEGIRQMALFLGAEG